MALEIKLNQKLSQTLVMTPQLQQAIKLLQLGRMEYLEVIERELLENPVLEDTSDSFDNNQSDQNSTEYSAERDAEERSVEPRASASDADEFTPDGDYRDPVNDIRRGDDSDMPFDSLFYSSFGGGRADGDGERPSLEATVSSPEGLANHLLWQLRTGDLGQEDQEIAIQIIWNLDRNGYLCCSLEELAELCGRPVADIERVLALVHTLDPPGVGARDLRECLLIQLDQLGLREALVGRVVSDYLPEIESRRYEVISRKENVPVESVYEAVKEIQKLEPRPGRPFVDEMPIYITPDIYVRKVGDEYHLSLNENGMPKLRLNPEYQRLLSSGVTQSHPDKEYLQDRLRSASWLIKSIQQRQQTIYRVTESIMRHQREFLEHGVSALRPLVLRDIAADVGMHESTVSRVTTNKYVHTPQGVFELKFFFSSGLKASSGEVSSESVKEKIRDLIAKENPRKPLSDQAIVSQLRAEGIDIARRTVAKYREMMNVPSSSSRKKLF